MNARRLAILMAAPMLAASLSACISVLPKTKPDQLYSFGATVDVTAPASAETATALGVLLAGIDFPRAATGDGILTRTGTQNAYLAQSRWVGPASLLFREAVGRIYDRTAHNTRLIGRGEAGRTPLVLRLDVRDFEAVYADGPMSPPVVLVSLRARLTRPTGELVDEKLFDVRRAAGDNRVGPIVDAFDKATAEALTGLVAWTDQTAASLPREARAAAPAAVVQSTTRTTTTRAR